MKKVTLKDKVQSLKNLTDIEMFPCGAEDIIYLIRHKPNITSKKVEQAKVLYVTVYKKSASYAILIENCFQSLVFLNEYNKTWFTDPEKAKEAAKLEDKRLDIRVGD